MSSITEYITVAVALVFCGGVITLIAAFRFARSRERDSSKLARWLVLIGGLITLIGGALTAVEQGKMSQKMTQLSTQTLAYQTGSDSYPYIGCSGPDSPTDSIYCALYSVGEFPLYGIRVYVSDLTMLSQELDHKDPLFPEKFAKIADESQRTIAVGDVERQTKVFLTNLPYPAHQHQQDYKFSIRGRNGLWVQLVQWRSVNGKWERASRLGACLEDSVSILLEDISHEFPRSEIRELRWN